MIYLISMPKSTSMIRQCHIFYIPLITIWVIYWTSRTYGNVKPGKIYIEARCQWWQIWWLCANDEWDFMQIFVFLIDNIESGFWIDIWFGIFMINSNSWKEQDCLWYAYQSSENSCIYSIVIVQYEYKSANT
jgi:hypothetical protein